MNMRVSELKPGEQGQIKRVSGRGAVKRRIREMGMTTGRDVEVISVAPLGEPVVLGLNGSRVMLGQGIAAKVWVQESGQHA